MIHPNTTIKLVNPEIGLGVFATEFIPMGTVVFVDDPLDIIIKKDDPILSNPHMLDLIDKFSYREHNGNLIVCWDHGKYVNHSCESNCIATGYGFEIARRDIQKGEELTDDYGSLNIDDEMIVNCGCENCRGVVRPSDFEKYYKEWDRDILNALEYFDEVDQPLMKYMDSITKKEISDYLKTKENYKSVYAARYKQRKMEDVFHSS